jgi:hypothetical protein
MAFISPTLVSYTDVAWTTTTSPKTLSLTWQADDAIVAIFGCEGTSTFTISGPSLTLPTLQTNLGGTSCAAALFGGVQNYAGTAVTITGTSSGSGLDWGFGIWVFRGVSVLGASYMNVALAPAAFSFTPFSTDPAVVWATFDFAGATVKTVVPTPTDARQAQQIGGRYSFYVSDLIDQTTAGAVSYGLGTITSGALTQIGCEIIGVGVQQETTGSWITPIQQRM